MSFDGNGDYAPPSPEFPAVSGDYILADDFNTIILDLSDALTACVVESLITTPAASSNDTTIATTAFVNNVAMSTELPAQSGNAGKIIQTDGTNASWISLPTPEMSFTFTGAASAGDPLVLNSDGTVSAVAETASNDWTDEFQGLIHGYYTGNLVGMAFNDNTGFGMCCWHAAHNKTETDWYDHVMYVAPLWFDENNLPQLGAASVLPNSTNNIDAKPTWWEAANCYVLPTTNGPTSSDNGLLYTLTQNPETGELGIGSGLEFDTTGNLDNKRSIAVAGGDYLTVLFIGATNYPKYSLFGVNADGGIERHQDNQTLESQASVLVTGCWDEAESKFVLGTQRSAGTQAPYVFTATVSSDTLSVSSAATIPGTFSSGGNDWYRLEYHRGAAAPVAIFQDGSGSNIDGCIIDTSAATPVPGSAQQLHVGQPRYDYSCDTSQVGDNIVAFGEISTTGSTWHIHGIIITESSGTLTGTATSFGNGHASSAGVVGTKQGLALGLQCGSGTDDVWQSTVYVTNTTNLKPYNFIGFAQEAATNGQEKKVDIIGGRNTSLSGLTQAEPVYVRPDATIGHTRMDRGVRVGVADTTTSAINTGVSK